MRLGRALLAVACGASIPVSGAACNAIVDNRNGVLARRDAAARDGASSGDDGSNGAGDDSGTGGGCDADLAIDSLNCGRCQHDCIGTPCVGGHCSPLAIADSATTVPQGVLAVDDANVYWMGFDGLYRASLRSGGAVRLRLATAGSESTTSIVATQGHLAWLEYTNEYVIRSCDPNDCGDAVTPAVVAHSVPYPSFFGASSEGVYFRWPSPQEGVWLARWSGSGPELVEPEVFAALVVGFANDRAVAWAFGSADAGGIRVLPLPADGAAPRSIAVPEAVAGVALSRDGDAFWTTRSQVTSAPLDGGPPRAIASTSLGTKVRVCGARVFFVSDGRLQSCPTVGACATPDSVSLHDVTSLEANDTFAVWQDGATGAIFRVAP